VQDCLEFKWLASGSTPQTIYHATEIVSASGTLQATSNTVGMTHVTVAFSIGSTAVTSFNLGNKESTAFTVVGFDTITLTGHAPSQAESATGTLCMTPRYELF
jgi:hypothetical protein